MNENLGEILDRANFLNSRGIDHEIIARNLNVEFYATAYSNKGALWVSYKDLSGKDQRRTVL